MWKTETGDALVPTGHHLGPPRIYLHVVYEIGGDRGVPTDATRPRVDQITPVIPPSARCRKDGVIADLGLGYPHTPPSGSGLVDKGLTSGHVSLASGRHALTNALLEALLFGHLHCFQCHSSKRTDNPRSSAHKPRAQQSKRSNHRAEHSRSPLPSWARPCGCRDEGSARSVAVTGPYHGRGGRATVPRPLGCLPWWP